MRTFSRLANIATAALGVTGLLVVPTQAQVGRGRPPGPVQQAQQLDRQGAYREARAIFQRLIDTAPHAAARAAAERHMAMSYGFEGDCANTVKYEEMVIAYWATREQAEPQNAFYQQGEMANEAARVCLDVGELETAERMYRRGRELGLKEPEPKAHPKSLWDYRLAHALGRIAARRGDKAAVQRHVVEARRILDSDPDMARAQERFFPYLAGYVAFYTNDPQAAAAALLNAVGREGNQRDPFMHCLLAMTYEKLGQEDTARALYQQAYDMAIAHNPAAAFARRFARAKLGIR